MCLFLYWPFCHGAHKLDLFFFEHLFNLYSHAIHDDIYLTNISMTATFKRLIIEQMCVNILDKIPNETIVS